MANYKTNTKEGKCVFCEIAKGNLHTPGIFWEDKEFMAFLSIFPNTEGFTVVIPKKHYDSDVLSLEDKFLHKFISASKKVSKILLKHYPKVGRIGLIMEGTGINHAHIKLVPMHNTPYLKGKGKWKQCPSGRDDFFKSYPGYIMSNDGPKADLKKIEKLGKELKKIK